MGGSWESPWGMGRGVLSLLPFWNVSVFVSVCTQCGGEKKGVKTLYI